MFRSLTILPIIVLASTAIANTPLTTPVCGALVRLLDSPALTEAEHRVAQQMILIRAENRWYERAIEEAHQLFPNDPWGRIQHLHQVLNPADAARAVGVDSQGRPSFNGMSFARGWGVRFSQALNTPIFTTRRWDLHDADIDVLVLHGQGGLASHTAQA